MFGLWLWNYVVFVVWVGCLWFVVCLGVVCACVRIWCLWCCIGFACIWLTFLVGFGLAGSVCGFDCGFCVCW